MVKETNSAAGARVTPIVGAAAAGGLLVAAAIAYVTLRDPGDTSAPAPAPEAMTRASDAALPEDTAAAPAAAPAPAPAPADASPSEAAQAAPDTVAEPSPAAAPDPAPRFDVVRVDALGSAVIAGQAGSGARVTLKIDGEPVEVIDTDGGGNFVAMLALRPSELPRVLSLEAARPGAVPVPGAATVIIAPFGTEALAAATQAGTPPEPPPAQGTDRPGVGEATSSPPATPTPGDAAAVIAGAQAPVPAEPGSTPNADVASAALPDAPAGVSAPPGPGTDPAATASIAGAPQGDSPVAAPEAAPQAPAILMVEAGEVRVLQGPGSAPAAQTEIRLDAITYDVTGDVTLAGRGPSEASVRVTLNNQPINMGEIGPGGQWSLGLPDVDPGTYTLRVEQLAADGSVTRTVTTPFLREDPARIRANPMLVDPGASVITVQRGFTLWGIAEANFGDGILYVQIFEENRGEIRDPDLIFPGQIFALPDLPRAGAGGSDL